MKKIVNNVSIVIKKEKKNLAFASNILAGSGI